MSQSSPPNIVLCIHDPALIAAATQLAKALELPCYLTSAPELNNYHYYLDVCPTDQSPGYKLGLSLNNQQQTPLFIDFTTGKSAYRRKHSGRQQSIARAVGIKPHVTLDVLDVTAGLGQDAFVLAGLGCRVRLVERSPIIAALLDNALQRAATDPDIQAIVSNMYLLQRDAVDLMQHGDEQLAADVVYMDPMYPHRTKSALVKKSMRLLRGIVGDDQDSDRLLNAALKFARKRVVVKRPKGAPIINQQQPSHRIEDKSTRFDVYMIHHPDSVDQ